MSSKQPSGYPSPDFAYRKSIKLPDVSGLTVDRASDETGSFAKSEMDKLKVHKALSQLRPFSGRSREEIMEFVCYMFELQGSSNETICHASERNRCFYFIANGQLLHRRPGVHRAHMIERRLLELDYWGLECLATGRDERISVTATSQCRLFVLTARRFFWLCRMSAQRTHQMQLRIADELVYKHAKTLRKPLGLQHVDDEDSADKEAEGKQSDQKQSQLMSSKNFPAAARQQQALRRANPHLLDGLLHSIRQLDVTAHREEGGEPSVTISCNSSQIVLVYCLAGCVSLQLDYCSKYNNASPKISSTILYPGNSLEIGANENWKMANGSSALKQQQSVVYLIQLRSNEKISDGAGE